MAVNMELIEKMPMSRKAIILGVIILLLAAGWYYFLYQPLGAELAKVNADLEETEGTLRNLENKKSQVDKLKDQIDSLDRDLVTYRKQLPADVEMGEFLLQIDEIGKSNGIAFSMIKPKGASAAKDWREIPVDLDFTGSYRYVMNFFYELASQDRIVKFDDIRIKTSSSGNDISVKTVAITYAMK